MEILEYPFDAGEILKRSKRIRRTLMELPVQRVEKNIAILGGSTTHDIVRILELFLLHFGIKPDFYESEYGQYWQDAMFPPDALKQFAPDVVYIHLSEHNITDFPLMTDAEEDVERKLGQAFAHLTQMYDCIRETHHCTIITDNFAEPYIRLLGNKDAVDIHGRVRFVRRLNEKIAEYAMTHEGVYINDAAYLAASYGLTEWSDPLYWYMYKYAVAVPAIPHLSYSIACIIKSLYGRNKKALVLDLDNTLWGGVIGDDGVEGIDVGEETAEGEAYLAFQRYAKRLKEIGIALAVVSKNDEENAIAGLNHPDGVLRPEDFVYIRANWEPKDRNIAQIAKDLNILPEAVVFADDNPAEREIVKAQLPGVTTPMMDTPERYIAAIDRAGYFETTVLSRDDLERDRMFKENAARQQEQAKFGDYREYLLSLDMTAQIKPFEDLYYPRIAQLTNKSNQFNLTTKRLTQGEIARIANDDTYITLYGRLTDKFGDNGIVALTIGHICEDVLDLELWLMSCRVLKRDMEYAMMDAVIDACRQRNIRTIRGYYIPTQKNKMVESFYEMQGFKCIEKETDEKTGRDRTTWEFVIPEKYQKKNEVIRT